MKKVQITLSNTHANIGDWLKDENGYYWQVVQITPENTAVKMGFDFELIYVKHTVRVGYYRIRLTDLKDFQSLKRRELARIKNFFSKNPEEEKSFSKQTEKMFFFREQIKGSGFDEAEHDFMQFHFFRHTTEKTAFIINLQDFGECIRIVYGFTSIPDEEFLKKNGEDSDVIKLRFVAEIRSEMDETAVASAIKTIFNMYRSNSKDEILALKHEKQKVFLQKINDKLKPYGFKKKGSVWTMSLDNGNSLEFYAQKSQWSDVYYFNISLYSNSNNICYQTRFVKNQKAIFDWQLLDDEEFNGLMDEILKTHLLPKINSKSGK